jgi:hypothetical protein
VERDLDFRKELSMKEQTDHEVVYYHDLHPRDGRLWGTKLDSWLVPDGPYLRLYDRDGQMRLTGEEAEARRADILAEKLRSLGINPDQLS